MTFAIEFDFAEKRERSVSLNQVSLQPKQDVYYWVDLEDQPEAEFRGFLGQMGIDARTSVHRTWGDAYGHMMVAVGRADVMFDPILNIWDAAPLLTIMREAGGVFSDTTGRETIESGNGFSCGRSLYPEIISIFEK